MSILAAYAVPHPPIMIPEVGRGQEAKMRATRDAYRAVMKAVAELKPETVIVTSPHAVLYSDYFHISPGASAEGDFGEFRAPQVTVRARYDAEFVSALSDTCARADFPAGTLGEKKPRLDHGTMLPLYALNEYYRDYKVVRASLSGLSPAAHYRFGQLIAQTADALSRRAVLIASGDLSHKLKEDGPYGFAPEGPEFDRRTTEALAAADFLSLLNLEAEFCEAAAECGLRSLWVMAGALDRRAVKSALLSYEGPFGVGYGVAAFSVAGEDAKRNIGERYEREKRSRLLARKQREDAHVRLARLSLETYVATGSAAELPENLLAELLSTRAGAFVSIKKDGQLRGCIGTIEPTQESLAREIVQNAISAAHDPRFDPVTPEELDDLTYSVDVLGKAEPVSSERELDAKRYGVIVMEGARRGLLLPDLAGVDTPREQIEIARRKAGIAPGAKVALYRFEVVRHV